MKKKMIVIMTFVLGILFLPKNVLATPIIDEENQMAEFSVCKSGCDVVNLDDLLTTLQDDIYDNYVVFINFQDSTDHKILEHDLTNLNAILLTSNNNSNINISGYSDNVKLKVKYISVGEIESGYTFKLTDIQIIQSAQAKDFCDYDLDCGALSIKSNAYINNVSISAQTPGLNLFRGQQYTIDGYTYKGGNYAIVVIGEKSDNFPERSINITNSKMADCDCSLIVMDFFNNSGLIDSFRSSFKRSTSNKELFRRIANITNYNIKVDSSEVNCVKYGAENSQSATNPTIYFTSSNKWFKSIKRSKDNDISDDSLYNVIEGYNSKIIIDQEIKKALKITEEGDLLSYFPELKDVDPSLISWSVEDNSILKIANGKAIPLKIGSTIVTATYKNTNYTINFRISSRISDITNPNTGSTLLLVVGLMVLISALVSVKFFQHSK